MKKIVKEVPGYELHDEAGVSWGRERPETERWRHERRWVRAGVTVVLPRGFNVGLSGRLSRTDYEGNWFPHTASEPGFVRLFRAEPAACLAVRRCRPGGLQSVIEAASRGSSSRPPILRERG